VEIPGPELMASAAPYFIYPGFAFYAYANRDSTGFKESYQIPEAETVIRGTLRYQGFTEFVKALVDMGMLSEDPKDFLGPGSKIAWKDALAKILGSSSPKEKYFPHSEGSVLIHVRDLISAICLKTKFSSTEEMNRIISGMKWLGLFSDSPITPRRNPLDTLCATLEEKMQYGPGERDMCILQHKFLIEHKDGRRVPTPQIVCKN
jgi:saccharopine dehydrogenase (NADP+, L-glutamate forming)